MAGVKQIYQVAANLKQNDHGIDPRNVYQGADLKKNDGIDPRHVHWLIMKTEDYGICDSESIESAREDSSFNSEASSSSSDLIEDASSSSPTTSSSSDLIEDASSSSPTTSSSSPNSSYGPLYELSELMNQLPIKRGLSNYYQGKSQSFTSLANVKSLENLAKKVGPYSQRMKSCKSYAGFDGHKFGPKATITKKSSRGSFFSSLGSRGNFVG